MYDDQMMVGPKVEPRTSNSVSSRSKSGKARHSAFIFLDPPFPPFAPLPDGEVCPARTIPYTRLVGRMTPSRAL